MTITPSGIPTSGSGILADGAVGSQLAAVTRRSFLPSAVVQMMTSTPLLSALLKDHKVGSGGMGAIVQPVVSNNFANAQWMGPSGTFPPYTENTPVTDATWQWAMLGYPVQLLITERLQQMNAAVLDILEARFNDASLAMKTSLSTALMNTSAAASTSLVGLYDAVDASADGVYTASAGGAVITPNTYAGIDRSANTWWKSRVKRAGTAVGAGAAPTVANITKELLGYQKFCGEMPTMGVVDPGTFSKVISNLGTTQTPQAMMRPGEAWGDLDPMFQSFTVAGVPFFMDVTMPLDTYGNANHNGKMYLFNLNYLWLQQHRDASFVFTGFESTVPNYQVGWMGFILDAIQLVCNKPMSQSMVYNWQSDTIS